MPPSPPITRRKGYHHGNLREALVGTAKRLVAERGPGGFTLVEAARLAGVSPAAPYRHFRDRDALLAELARRGFALFEDRLRHIAETPTGNETDFEERFLRMGAAYLAFAREEPGLYAAMFATSASLSSTAPRDGTAPGEAPCDEAASAHDHKAGAFAVLVEALQRAFPDAFDPASLRLVALEVWALSHGVAMLVTSGRLPQGEGIPTPETILADGVRALVRGAARQA